MFSEIKSKIGDNEELLTAINDIEAKYGALKERADKADNLVSNLKEEKSKMKSFITGTKEVLGIEEGEELSVDTLSKKIGKIKDKYKATGSKKEQDLIDQIANYEKALQDEKSKFETEISKYEKENINNLIELELMKGVQDVDAFNSDAANEIMRLMREGNGYKASYEEGKLVYRNESGALIKGEDGLSDSGVKDILAKIKSDESKSYLFKRKEKSGTGEDLNGSGTGAGSDDGSIEARLKARMMAK